MLNRHRLLLAVAVLIVLAMIAVIYRGIGFTTKEAAEKAEALIIAVMGLPSLLVSVKGFLTKSPAAGEVVLAPAPSSADPARRTTVSGSGDESGVADQFIAPTLKRSPNNGLYNGLYCGLLGGAFAGLIVGVFNYRAGGLRVIANIFCTDAGPGSFPEQRCSF